MVQSQSVRLQLWRRPVDEDGVERCEEHTVTNSSPDTNAAQYAYVEAISVESAVTLLQLLPGFNFMGASHLSVTYTIQQGEIIHQSINFVKAGDKIFNTYVFRPQREGKSQSREIHYQIRTDHAQSKPIRPMRCTIPTRATKPSTHLASK